jgi:uncharacterized membrane protein YdjX (TVP38/TMEM64 family)
MTLETEREGDEHAPVKDILRPAMLMCLVLLIPILPFLLFGEELEAWIETWTESKVSRETAAALVVGILATDILLPVPSSVVSTWGGQVLGTMTGTLTSWLGMTAGAVLGFALARLLGYRFAKRFSRPEELERVDRLCQRWGPMTLVLARGVPVLAEASVLLMGVHKLGWHRFIWPVVLSNLGIALAYSAFGDIGKRQGWLALTLAVAMGLPVVLLMIARRWFESAGAASPEEAPTDE